MAKDNGISEQAKGPTAPYISFQTVKNVARDMKEHGLPSRIDRSVFSTLSGGVIGQLLPAMKFLRLITDDGQPTTQMKALVDAAGTDAWSVTLKDVVRAAYAPMFSMNLETASPSQFNEAFRKYYPGTDDVSRKSQTFFLNAVREAGINISPYIMKNKKPRSATTKRRVKANGGVIRSIEPPPLESAKTAAPQTDKSPSEILLSLFDPQMEDTEQQAIWTLIKYFKAKGK